MRETILSRQGRLRGCLQVTCVGSVAGALVACGSSNSSGPGDGGVTSLPVTSTVLIADQSDAGAVHADTDLVNAWGLAFGPTGTAWISDNGTGKATLFSPNADGGPIASVLVPAPPAGKAGATAAPTGMVFNSNSSNSASFLGDVFIASTEDGTISGWQPFTPTAFTIRVDRSAGAPTTNAVYKGLAIVPTSPPLLLAANFRARTIDVFNSSYALEAAIAASAPVAWVDPSVPADYAPFNVATMGQSVYVAYALQDSAKMDDSPGPGLGAVSVFDFNGNLTKSLIPVGGQLNAPWGMAIAPSTWGALSGMLLVGNFGAGNVNAFDPNSGALTGQLVTSSTNLPLVVPGLWSLVFGDDADAGISPNALYFTAGPNMEQNGRYGVITLAQ